MRSPGAGVERGLAPCLPLQVRLLALKDELSDLEEESVEVLQELLKEFDRNYSEMAELNKTNYNQFFTQVWLGCVGKQVALMGGSRLRLTISHTRCMHRSGTCRTTSSSH